MPGSNFCYFKKENPFGLSSIKGVIYENQRQILRWEKRGEKKQE